jgi:hypothetical protein
MIDNATRETIQGLFDSGHKLVYEFTGAGSLALAWLHSIGGSSRLLLEASDRYSPQSLAELTGRAAAKPVSAETSGVMAMRAYRRAVRLSDGTSPCIGLACTATIATDRTKRGKHACHVAVQTRTGRSDLAIVLAKGERDRLGEETVIARLIVLALAHACGIDSPSLELLPTEELIRSHTDCADLMQRLLDDQVRTVTIHPDGRMEPDQPFSGVLLSGSFNPLHCGHQTLLRVAAKFLQAPAAYELPVLNADKPALLPNEIERRVGQFSRAPVILTRVPLFQQKADLFPNNTFVIGYDTAVRVVDPHYYAGESGRDDALMSIAARGCRFLVAARPMSGDNVRTLADVTIPKEFNELFIELPRSQFLLDLSSTELRAQ